MYYPEYMQVNFPYGGFMQPQMPTPMTPTPTTPMQPPTSVSGRDEESYIENILRLNRGKIGTFYFTYENNNQWNSLVIRGMIETAGRDHIVLSDPQTGRRYLMLMINFDYAEFDEPINYYLPQINPNMPVVQG